MSWWAWIVVGAILLGSELTFVDAQFYLVFLGAAALVVGFVEWSYPNLPTWAQWMIFGVLAIATMVTFRKRVYGLLRNRAPQMNHGPAGDVVKTPLDLPPGESCRIEYRGSTWTAVNDGPTLIEAGAHARIAGVDGLTLKIIKAG